MANEFENLRLGTEEFQKAMKESLEKWSKDFEKIGEQIQKNVTEDKVTFMAYDDMYPEYGGRMKLNYLNGIGGWRDVLTVLIAHGYVVTAHIEDATETETELENVEKWVVIEFDEVE